MRLRQAHAILEAATALEAAGLGIDMAPFDYDEPGSLIDADRMDGGVDITDPDDDGNARSYNIELKPTRDERHVEAILEYGLGPDRQCLYRRRYAVTAENPDESCFRGLVGARIAEEIAQVIREHEQPYRTAYEERTGKKWETT